ncbi:hypothetical protein PSACC_01199 [Paramicrosporidium saccamoebae]|uniref:Uncharacterized protein n=1 Tax=Paramicrosporidium saccamoebae TaxID=1246581 RepID=A0A2H9TMI7_9FUNG|nr:hypothetical protein PSACC_01199 [Paramicrosporidium saccamoebae]
MNFIAASTLAAIYTKLASRGSKAGKDARVGMPDSCDKNGTCMTSNQLFGVLCKSVRSGISNYSNKEANSHGLWEEIVGQNFSTSG